MECSAHGISDAAFAQDLHHPRTENRERETIHYRRRTLSTDPRPWQSDFADERSRDDGKNFPSVPLLSHVYISPEPALVSPRSVVTRRHRRPCQRARPGPPIRAGFFYYSARPIVINPEKLPIGLLFKHWPMLNN